MGVTFCALTRLPYRAMKEINFLSDVLPLKDKLFRLALRITLDRAEAEDIVQDSLIRVWDHRAEWSQIENLEAFSITICRNLALDRSSRAVASNLQLDEQRDQRPDPQRTPEEELTHRQRIEIIRELMNQLPEVQRSIMELRDIEGKSYADIAKILNLNESQVKVYLHRARTKIRTQMERIEGHGL